STGSPAGFTIIRELRRQEVLIPSDYSGKKILAEQQPAPRAQEWRRAAPVARTRPTACVGADARAAGGPRSPLCAAPWVDPRGRDAAAATHAAGTVDGLKRVLVFQPQPTLGGSPRAHPPLRQPRHRVPDLRLHALPRRRGGGLEGRGPRGAGGGRLQRRAARDR